MVVMSSQTYSHTAQAVQEWNKMKLTSTTQASTGRRRRSSESPSFRERREMVSTHGTLADGTTRAREPAAQTTSAPASTRPEDVQVHLLGARPVRTVGGRELRLVKGCCDITDVT